MQLSPVTRRSLDQLEDEIISLSHRINASEYQFLELVREFDIRQGWRAYHFNNCAEWLNMKCGISLGAAREKVRVALALFDLPLCSKAFESGSLSYSKARAMTRIADYSNEQELLDYALSATASQVEDHCCQLRNAQRYISTNDANRAYKARNLTRTCHPDGSMSINLELPRELGELVMKAIEVAMACPVKKCSESKEVTGPKKCGESKDAGESKKTGESRKAHGLKNGSDKECFSDNPAVNEPASFFAKQADALVQIARQFLSGPGLLNGSEKMASTTDNYQVVVHVDESALHDKGGKSDLPIESVRRITCDSNIVEVTKDKKGNQLNLGRKHRVVSPQLKRALVSRDKCCRFPGCSRDRWLAAHHVMHWVDGGETSSGNTLLLCSTHHRLLHEGGYSIHKNFAGDWYFRNSNGKIIPGAPVFEAIHNSIHETIHETIHEPIHEITYNSASRSIKIESDASRDAFADDDWVGKPKVGWAIGTWPLVSHK